MNRKISFEKARGEYTNRYTMEHMPLWARAPHVLTIAGQSTPTGKFYAPQFRTDREWYDNTRFRGEEGWIGIGTDAYTTGQTWPLGQWLDTPFEVKR